MVATLLSVDAAGLAGGTRGYVLLSAALALGATAVVFELFRRAKKALGVRRMAWLAGGTAAAAAGIWSVQLVGILALRPSDVAAASLFVMGMAIIAAGINWRKRRTLERTVELNKARYRALTHAASDAIVSAD